MKNKPIKTEDLDKDTLKFIKRYRKGFDRLAGNTPTEDWENDIFEYDGQWHKKGKDGNCEPFTMYDLRQLIEKAREEGDYPEGFDDGYNNGFDVGRKMGEEEECQKIIEMIEKTREEGRKDFWDSDYLKEHDNKIRQEEKQRIIKGIERWIKIEKVKHLGYCKRQNGLPYCKNCGLNEECFEELIKNIK